MTRLRRWWRSGRVLRASRPHVFAVDPAFPVGCWCSQARDAAVHGRGGGGSR